MHRWWRKSLDLDPLGSISFSMYKVHLANPILLRMQMRFLFAAFKNLQTPMTDGHNRRIHQFFRGRTTRNELFGCTIAPISKKESRWTSKRYRCRRSVDGQQGETRRKGENERRTHLSQWWTALLSPLTTVSFDLTSSLTATTILIYLLHCYRERKGSKLNTSLWKSNKWTWILCKLGNSFSLKNQERPHFFLLLLPFCRLGRNKESFAFFCGPMVFFFDFADWYDWCMFDDSYSTNKEKSKWAQP